METYSRSYLMEVVETQGILFEKVKDYIPGIDVRHFITHYMNSKVRKLIDEGQAYLCTMDSEELFHYFLEFDKYQIKQADFCQTGLGSSTHTSNGFIKYQVEK